MARVGRCSVAFSFLVACGADTKSDATPTAEKVETAQKAEPSEAEAPKKTFRVPFAEQDPKVGDPAPDFELASLAGGTVKLSDITARGPTVLTFGSYS